MHAHQSKAPRATLQHTHTYSTHSTAGTDQFIPFLFGHCWIFGSSNRESKSKVKSPVHSYECNHLYE